MPTKNTPKEYWQITHYRMGGGCHKVPYTGVSYRPCETSQLFYTPTGD